MGPQEVTHGRLPLFVGSKLNDRTVIVLTANVGFFIGSPSPTT